jgi:hypothetical protein
MKKQLVVAWYKEDISWLGDLDCFDNIVVYRKGDITPPNLRCDFIDLPNVGREAHTHIHHIVNNYDNLYDITMFIQGDPFPHCATIKNGSELNTHFKNYIFSNEKAENLDNKLQIDYSGYTYRTYMECMDTFVTPADVLFSTGAQWMAPKSCIHSKSLNFYKKILEELKTDRIYNYDGIFNAWTLEGMWNFIFNPNLKEKLSFSNS